MDENKNALEKDELVDFSWQEGFAKTVANLSCFPDEETARRVLTGFLISLVMTQ